ncbi:Tfp pilus assembly protein FimT/FimU [Streptomyces phyllanthi]|nr:type II secretion system protein [Streptomyces phyllanthi]
MDKTRMEALLATLTVLGILALVVLPALIGAVRERRIDRQLREAEQREKLRDEQRRGTKDQKSSSKPTEPSTATWYAEDRRSKKLVSS